MTPKSIVYLLLYVDDLVLAGNNLDEIKHYKRELSSRFEMKDLGDVKYFLGLKIEYDMENGILQMSQRQYMKNVLKRFQMEDCKGISTPMESKLELTWNETSNGTQQPYRELIGCLMYGMLARRPDLSASVGYFSRFQSNRRPLELS